MADEIKQELEFIYKRLVQLLELEAKSFEVQREIRQELANISVALQQYLPATMREIRLSRDDVRGDTRVPGTHPSEQEAPVLHAVEPDTEERASERVMSLMHCATRGHTWDTELTKCMYCGLLYKDWSKEDENEDL